MSETTKIESALTAEEWGWYLKPGQLYDFTAWREAGTDDLFSDHQAAALALHDKPFGFSWADVDAIYEVFDDFKSRVGLVGLEQAKTEWPELSSLADRLAALLSPRDA